MIKTANNFGRIEGKNYRKRTILKKKWKNGKKLTIGKQWKKFNNNKNITKN